jgi:NodT family efflux transporter outer membrane factor (OMF) lipoprotein
MSIINQMGCTVKTQPLNTVILRAGCLLACLPLLASCTLGPVGTPPALPFDAGYTQTPIVLPVDAGVVLQPDTQANSPSTRQWWQGLGSAKLDALVMQALAHNPDLASQQAALTAAQALAAAGQSALFPNVQAGFSPSRQSQAKGISPTLSSGQSLFNLHTAQVQVTYPLDVFGGNRRQAEAGQALATQQAALVAAARITVINNVVLGSLNYAALQDSVRLTRQLVALNQTAFNRTQQQVSLGQVPEASLWVAQTALLQAQSTAANFEKQMALQRDQLAALVGQYPNQPLVLPASLAEFHLPATLPLSLPSVLVQNRPDIVAAAASVHAAAAEVGVAMAARLPQIAITADGGYTGSALAGLLSSPNQFWSLVGGITQPVFDAGGLAHRQKAAEAMYTQALETYRATVLNAFVNVADSLHALKADTLGQRTAVAAEMVAHQTWQAAQKQIDLGDISPLIGLTVEQNDRQAMLARVQAEAMVYQDVAALYQSLGGAW